MTLNRPMPKVSSKSSQNLMPTANVRNYLRDNSSHKYQSSSSINNSGHSSSVSTGKNISKTSVPIIKSSYRKKQIPPPTVNITRGISNPDPISSPSDCDTQFFPMATDRSVGLDLDEFLPRSHISQFENMSEQEVINTMMGGHDKVIAVLNSRRRNLQLLYGQWQSRDMKGALEYLSNMTDSDRPALLIDLLHTFMSRPSMWDLDMCVSLLPQIHDLLQSKYECYVVTGCEALRLILKNFASVIQSNVSSPVGSFGVDIPRAERYAKCVKCHDSLLHTRSFLLKRQTLQGKLGAAFRELQQMMQRLDVS